MRKYIHPLLFFVTFIIILVSSGAHASAYSDGVAVPVLAGRQALSTPMGVRAEGMAEANTGRADDLSALRYNPAGLSLMGYWEWGFNSHTLSNSVQANSLAVTAPLPYGNLGLYGQWLAVRDNLDVQDGLMVHPDRHKYSYHSGLSYAAPVVNRHFHAGGTVKFFAADFRNGHHLYPEGTAPYPRTQRGIFFDLGLLAYYDLSDLKGLFFYLPKVSVGFAARNLHPLFKLKGDEIYREYIPEYNVGFSAYYSHRFMLNFDIVNSPEFTTMFRTGAEIWPVYFLALRGGVMSQAEGGAQRGVYWGLGIGESIGSSKLSFEYSGRSVYEIGSTQAPRTYHSFAFHQSFENVLDYTDRYGKRRRIPLAITDRYVSQYRFAREISPEEIIDDAILFAQGDPNRAKKAEQKKIVKPKEDKEPPVIPDTPEETQPTLRRRGVAVFPFVEDFTTSEPFNNTFGKNLRGAILEFILSKKELRPLSDTRYKLTPKRERGESDVAYMNRLCKFHNIELVVFPVLVIDDRNTDLRARLLYYKAGDTEISAITERHNDYDRFALLQRDVVQDFALQVASLLDIDLSP